VTDDVRLHLERADDCIADAELLLAAARLGAAVSRAYYAMFHAATAAFGQVFAKPELIDVRFHRHLADAFDLRQESDYLPIVRLRDEKAREVLGWAREFVAVCRMLCG
jgi:uncharacterized protein (UPF0332 family)